MIRMTFEKHTATGVRQNAVFQRFAKFEHHFVGVNKMVRISAPDAGGIPSCSRWLSAATPPDPKAPGFRTPAGVPAPFLPGSLA